MGKRPRLQSFQPNGPRPLVDSATYTENTNEFNSEGTQKDEYITYTRPVLKEVREDSMLIFTQYQLSRDQEYLPGNKLEGFKPPTKRKLIYYVKLHGLKEQGENLEELVERIKDRDKKRMQSDNALLSLQSGINVGLDEDCIRQFCQDNELSPEQTITRSDLRRIVLERRNMNANQYGVGLRLLRIPIEPYRSNN